MTAEIARIIRQFSPVERAMYRASGGRIPPGTPKPLIIWRSKDVYPWTASDAKRTQRTEAA